MNLPDGFPTTPFATCVCARRGVCVCVGVCVCISKSVPSSSESLSLFLSGGIEERRHESSSRSQRKESSEWRWPIVLRTCKSNHVQWVGESCRKSEEASSYVYIWCWRKIVKRALNEMKTALALYETVPSVTFITWMDRVEISHRAYRELELMRCIEACLLIIFTLFFKRIRNLHL